MIVLRDVRKTFNEGRPDALTAVDGVTLSIADRSFTVLEGPSGSGKTSLLALIGCMARPSAGRIFLGDREITSLPERFLTAIRRRTFGFVFQQLNLVQGLTTLENVMLPAYPNGERRSALVGRALGLLERLGIRERAHSRADWLSGGEAQRVAIARALVNDPAVLIADEPTAHLDSRLSREFMQIMAELRAQRRTILIASHDPIVYGSPDVDRVVKLRDGRIAGEGP